MRKPIIKNRRPAAICPFPDAPGHVVADGEHSDLVFIIQLILESLAPFYDFGSLPLTGRMDEATEAAVRRFQAVGGLPVTGLVDRATWDRLAEEYDLACRCDET